MTVKDVLTSSDAPPDPDNLQTPQNSRPRKTQNQRANSSIPQEAVIIPETQRKIEILWDKDDSQSVSRARRKFLRLSRRGWVAFATLSDGRKAHVISFDASLERITLVMPMEGG